MGILSIKQIAQSTGLSAEEILEASSSIIKDKNRRLKNMKDFNTIKGRHFCIVDGVFKLKSRKFRWHIPKALRGKNIQEGDLVTVESRDKIKKVIVTNVFREDIEETGKKYKPVMAKVDKAAYLNRIMLKTQTKQSEQPQN